MHDCLILQPNPLHERSPLRCRHCDAAVVDTPLGWCHEMSGLYTCNPDAPRSQQTSAEAPCIGCGGPARGPGAARGRIGDVAGPMCGDCAYWCDGNVTSPATPQGRQS
jgi:hypothetical protein